MNSKDNMFLLLFITATYACVNYNNSVLFYPAATFSFLFFAKTAHIFNKNVFFSINENTTNLNTNLINGTMLIHPVILYTYYAVLLVVVCFFLKTFFKKRCKNFTKKLKNNFLFKLVIISILLGCYWAEQELLWGGWWSWDFVEILAINLLLFQLYCIHKNCDYKPTDGFFNIKYMFCVLVCTIVFVRYNIINSIHNFVTDSVQNQYDTYILCCVVLCACNIYIHTIKKKNTMVYCFIVICNLTYLYCILNTVQQINVNTVIKFKHTLVNILVFTCLVFLKKLNRVWYSVVLLFFWTQDFLWLCSILLNFGFLFKKLLSCKWYIHINLIVLVFFFNHQLYLFGVQDAHNYTTQNIQIKTNFWVETYSNPFQNFNTKSTTTPNNVYCENILQKNIFEKTIKVKTLVEECYNFNNQTLIQTYASSFICSILILTILLSTYLKKLKINNITFNIKI